MAKTDARTRLDPAERRRQLIALGVGALAERPLAAITPDLLAEAAGVSRGLVFHYFGSKSRLHHEIVSAARDSLMRATEPRTDLDPEHRLRDTIERFVRFAVEHRPTFYSLVRGAASDDEDVRRTVDEVRDAQADRLAAVFGERGVVIDARVRLGLRSWVALAEQALTDGSAAPAVDQDDLADFLVGTAHAVVGLLVPESAGRAIP